jgi:hypothetical protein
MKNVKRKDDLEIWKCDDVVIEAFYGAKAQFEDLELW